MSTDNTEDKSPHDSSTDDTHDVERDDDLGASQLTVSETVKAYAYDDVPGEITVDVDALDRAPADATTANLSLADAAQLREDLGEALSAHAAERERYDEEVVDVGDATVRPADADGDDEGDTEEYDLEPSTDAFAALRDRAISFDAALGPNGRVGWRLESTSATDRDPELDAALLEVVPFTGSSVGVHLRGSGEGVERLSAAATLEDPATCRHLAAALLEAGDYLEEYSDEEGSSE